MSNWRLVLAGLIFAPLACGADPTAQVVDDGSSSSTGDTGAVSVSDSSSAATSSSAGDGGSSGPAHGTDETSSASDTVTHGSESTSEGANTDGTSSDDGTTSDGTTTAGGGATSATGSTSASGTTSEPGSTSVGGTTTGDGGSTTEPDTSTGDAPDPSCTLACDAPCEIVLSEGLHGVTSIQHDGSRFAARDYYGKLVLRDAASLDVLLVEHDTTWTELGAGVLAVGYDDGSVLLRASDDLEPLGEAVADGQGGLAIDGSYVWVASPTGIDVLDVDGSPIWSTDGNFYDARVLALPDSLHVFADGFDDESVLHVDLASGITGQTTFEGSFVGWFGDAPRYWSQQGSAYRLYESDGTELAFGIGSIVHGWGDHLVLNGAVVHISDVDAPLLEGLGGYVRRSGPALAIYGASSQIVVLDAMGPQQEAFPTACCSPPDSYGWQFGWSPTGWVIGRSDGVVGDQLDREMSMGPVERIDAALGGRFTLLQPGTATAIMDVVDDCELEQVGELALLGGAHELSPDGSVIASGVDDPDFLDNSHQTLLNALPGGEEIGYFGNSGCSNCFMQRWSMSDDASVLGFNWDWTGMATSGLLEVPSGMSLGGLSTNVLPAIAPSGLNHALTAAAWGPGSSYEDSVSYTYEGGVLADVVDGVVWGFVDDEHLLLSHYELAGNCGYAGGCDTHLGTDIVELDGDVVQVTSLPDVREFVRISDTEIFVADPPRIFDVYTSELLWSIPDTAFAGPISADLVVASDGASLSVHRWR